jgi:squalene monooxygenase
VRNKLRESSHHASLEVLDFHMSYDVIIAGGGIAGSSVAAALGEFGCRVLLIEPGLHHPRRLAGELIHPRGVSDLSNLGLLGSLEQVGGVPVHGFAALPSPYLLPYKDVPGLATHGLAIEHAIMAEALLFVVSKLPHVTIVDLAVRQLQLTVCAAVLQST